MTKKLLTFAVLAALGALAVAGNLSCASTRCAVPGPKLDLPASAAEVDSADGTCLETFSWPAQGEPKAVVVVVHGIRDHALRYSELARALNAEGYAVYSHDMRGHGHSGGARQRFDSMDQLVGDLRQVVEAAHRAHPAAPVFLYGHSLGGLVSTSYALRYQSELAGLMLSGPALKLLPNVTSGQISAARFFGTVLPGLPAQAVDDSEFVSTPEARQDLQADPFVFHDNLPARSARAAIDGIDAAHARLSELTLPILVMHGTVDKATNVEGSQDLQQAARSSDKTLKLWEGQYHDLLHEPRRQDVVATVVTWLAAHAH